MLRSFAEGTLFGHVHGTLPATVLALHGWGRSGADFDGVLAGLDAVALDLPGFGATPEPPPTWGSAEYARAVEGALPEIGTPLVVVGHSFGGRIAVMLAARRPDAVRALVLTGVPLRRGHARPPAAPFRFARWLHGRGLLGDQLMERARQRYGSDDYRMAKGVMRSILVRVIGEEYEETLAALECPVWLVWGELDEVTRPELAEWAMTILREGRLAVVPGAGHHVVRQAPAALRAAIVEALEGG